MINIPNSENLQSKVERYKQRLLALRTAKNRFYNGLEQQKAGGIYDEDTKLIRFGVWDKEVITGKHSWAMQNLLTFGYYTGKAILNLLGYLPSYIYKDPFWLSRATLDQYLAGIAGANDAISGLDIQECICE